MLSSSQQSFLSFGSSVVFFSTNGTELWLKPRSWSLLCRASRVIQHDITSAVTLIPSLTNKPHAPPPIRHPQNVKARWSHVGKLNPGPCAARALVLQQVLLFFFWYVSVWQMFLMDLTVVQLRKSEFLPFGFDTEHIPLIAQVPLRVFFEVWQGN